MTNKPKYKAGDYLWIRDKTLDTIPWGHVYVHRSNFNFITNKLNKNDTEILYEVSMGGETYKNIPEDALFVEADDARVASGLPIKRPPDKFKKGETVWGYNLEGNLIKMKIKMVWTIFMSYTPAQYECVTYEDKKPIKEKGLHTFKKDELFKTKALAIHEQR